MTLIILTSIILATSCSYMKAHPAVEKEVIDVVEEVVESVIEGELKK